MYFSNIKLRGGTTGRDRVTFSRSRLYGVRLHVSTSLRLHVLFIPLFYSLMSYADMSDANMGYVMAMAMRIWAMRI